MPRHKKGKILLGPTPSWIHPSPQQFLFNHCMKVVCPALQYIPSDIHNKVVWPKNPKSRRYVDILVKDVAGTKIGHAHGVLNIQAWQPCIDPSRLGAGHSEEFIACRCK